ncbi:hypothetical protein BDL97_05G128500 [Sphagnum fallax]|nr:hypothetical protein BDL97_05G128500 [Sphagnum fallax]KAH8962965.1 hypothetical protein BDL97_05G128500 [Sphagnum fallax]
MDGCSLCLEDYSSKLSTISWAPTLESQPSHKKPDWFGTQFLIKSASPICVQSSCQRVVVIVHYRGGINCDGEMVVSPAWDHIMTVKSWYQHHTKLSRNP